MAKENINANFIVRVRSSRHTVIREHYVCDLVVAKDQDIVRIKVLAVVPSMPEEDSEAHALAPATGIIVGIGLSIMLWSFVIPLVFWIR